MADAGINKGHDQVSHNAVVDERSSINVTLDLERLRRARSSAKANVTKKIKNLTEWNFGYHTISEAELKSCEFEEVVKKFNVAHAQYHGALNDEIDVVDSDEYFNIETQRIDNFRSTLETWLRKLEAKSRNEEIEIRSNHSVGNRSNRSNLSKASSASSAASRIAAKAKKAVLMVERDALGKQHALEREALRLELDKRKQDEERLKLEQKKSELQLEIELAKAEAEERVYDEAILYDQINSVQTAAPIITLNERAECGNGASVGVATSQRSRQQRSTERSNLVSAPPQPSVKEKLIKDGSDDSSEIAEDFLRNMIDIQQQQQQQNQKIIDVQHIRDQQLEQLIGHHKDLATSMSLPQMQVPVFSGDPIDYCHYNYNCRTSI